MTSRWRRTESHPDGSRARASCGEAHGASGELIDAGDPPATVDVPALEGGLRYQLVRQPRTWQPARDSQGNYLYLPGLNAGS